MNARFGAGSVVVAALGATGCVAGDEVATGSESAEIRARKGFTVEIAGHGFLPIKEVAGGALECDGPDGGCAPGEVPRISELELVAFVTPDQKHFADIAKKVAIAGEQYRTNIVVTENPGSPNATFTLYEDCLLTSYDIPRLSEGGDPDRLMTETATFLPTSRRPLGGAGSDDGRYKRMTDANFRINIKGIGDMPNAVSGDFGKVTIEAFESTQGDEPEYSYGAAHWDSVAISLQQGPENKPLFDWFTAAQANPADPASRRDVTARVRAGNGARIWSAKACFPTAFFPGGEGSGGNPVPARLVCSPAHVLGLDSGDHSTASE